MRDMLEQLIHAEHAHLENPFRDYRRKYLFKTYFHIRIVVIQKPKSRE
jgi:hypothetical protein